MLAWGQMSEPLYINGIRLDSLPARYAVVRMYRVVTGENPGTFRILFDYGQLTEAGDFRTRYEKTGALPELYLSNKQGTTHKVKSRAAALNLLYAHGWKLVQYVPTSTADEKAPVEQRFEIIVEQRE